MRTPRPHRCSSPRRSAAGLRAPLWLGLWLGLGLGLAGAGCMSIPPEVAADLTAPDGRRPNHYALRTDQAAPAAVGGAKGGAETAARRPTGATGAADRTGDGR